MSWRVPQRGYPLLIREFCTSVRKNICHLFVQSSVVYCDQSGREFVGGGKQSKILTSEEEAQLVAHLSWCKRVGFGLTYHTLQLLIQELLEAVVR